MVALIPKIYGSYISCIINGKENLVEKAKNISGVCKNIQQWRVMINIHNVIFDWNCQSINQTFIKIINYRL